MYLQFLWLTPSYISKTRGNKLIINRISCCEYKAWKLPNMNEKSDYIGRKENGGIVSGYHDVSVSLYEWEK